MRPFIVLTALVGCVDPALAPASGLATVHLREHLDEAGEAEIVLDVSGIAHVEIHLDGAPRIVEVDAEADAAELGDDEGAAYSAGFWFRPRAYDDDVIELALAGGRQARIWARGAPVPPAERDTSLVWTDAALLDDPDVVGLGRLLTAAGGDTPGGVLLDRWFRRFATTIHSERAAPAQLMDEIASVHGDDPAGWDLDALPFVVTGVHNRLDLGPRGGGCGELRVSVASTHPIYAPLHLLFLFRQEPAADDVAPDGDVHCAGTARRWARLSGLAGEAFSSAAKKVLDGVLVPGGFLLAETVELTVSPWEWRQWLPSGPAASVPGTEGLDNPPLFQTVATPLVNQPGELREAFLAFVAENAGSLAARELVIPAAFRARSAQAPPSVPAERLDLTGLDPAILAAFPNLRDAIERIGCPTCHTENANFVQTLPDRSFSPFYDRELDARAAYLDALNGGDVPDAPPFGPLQALPD